ncbi:MAG: hypothetical protein IT292_06275 [Deltaproteobacteria bacterium]|nr:hypothetical protein [Deltaproteobacteria bacterium]
MKTFEQKVLVLFLLLGSAYSGVATASAEQAFSKWKVLEKKGIERIEDNKFVADDYWQWMLAESKRLEAELNKLEITWPDFAAYVSQFMSLISGSEDKIIGTISTSGSSLNQKIVAAANNVSSSLRLENIEEGANSLAKQTEPPVTHIEEKVERLGKDFDLSRIKKRLDIVDVK